MSILAVLLLLLLLISLAVFRVEILSPVGIQCLMWGFTIAGAYLTVAAKYPVYHEGTVWLLLHCIISIIAYRCVIGVPKKEFGIPLWSTAKKATIPWGVLKLFIVFSFLPVLMEMRQNGISFSLFGNLNALQSVSHEMAVKHYENAETPSLLSQVLNTFLYVTPLCSGYSIVHAKNRREYVLCLVSIIPVIMLVLLTTAKLTLVSYVILFFVAYMISYISLHGRLMEMNRAIVMRAIIVFAAAFGLFVLSFWLRIGEKGTSVLSLIIEKLSVYMFGHVQGFDVWFHRFAFLVTPTFGANTFLAISSRLGLAQEKTMGVYDIINGSCTNVYTQFRALIEDFTPVPALLISGIGNAWLAMEIRIICRRGRSVFHQTVAAMLFFYYLYFIISAWVYTTYLLAFFFFYVFLLLTYRLKFKWGQ